MLHPAITHINHTGKMKPETFKMINKMVTKAHNINQEKTPILTWRQIKEYADKLDQGQRQQQILIMHDDSGFFAKVRCFVVGIVDKDDIYFDCCNPAAGFINWQAISYILSDKDENTLDYPVLVLVDPDENKVKATDINEIEEDIYSSDELDSGGTLQQLKELEAEDFNAANYTLATPRGTVFIYCDF